MASSASSLTLAELILAGRGGAAQSFGPPAQVFGVYNPISASDLANATAEMGKFVHDVEGEMFCESVNTKIPYFNAPIYLENKVCRSIAARKKRLGS